MSSISFTRITFLSSHEKWHVTISNIVHFMNKKIIFNNQSIQFFIYFYLFFCHAIIDLFDLYYLK